MRLGKDAMVFTNNGEIKTIGFLSQVFIFYKNNVNELLDIFKRY